MLKETDYLALRSEQKIKIDFSGFPEMLVQHFGFLENEKDAASQTFFYSVFEMKKNGDATFVIQESNKFKESTHLALKFKAATDEQIKNYLSEKLTREKALNEELAINNSKLEEVGENRMRECETLSAKLRQLENDRNKELEGLSLNEQRKLQELREKSHEHETRIKKEYEEGNRKLLAQHEHTVR